ncbi:MAG: hypothetical protein AAF591_05560 [Verrucomicrobiota bacterium]
MGLSIFLGGVSWGEPLAGVNVNPADWERLAAWEAWTGGKAEMVGDNLYAVDWDGLSGANPQNGVGHSLERWRQGFRSGKLRGGSAADYAFELAVPMFPDLMKDDERRWYVGMGDEAIGELGWLERGRAKRVRKDAERAFRSLARVLVREGFGKARLRLGWEFNLDEDAWRIEGNPERWDDFQAVWRNVHGWMMSEPGAEFTWVWNVLLGYNEEARAGSFDPVRHAYPGDEYVDVVSCDVYDGHPHYFYRTANEAGAGEEEMARRWEMMWVFLAEGRRMAEDGSGGVVVEGVPCLESYRAFARERGKLFAISEWGLVGGLEGGRDNVYFLERMHAWMRASEVAYANYFEFMEVGEDGETVVVDHALMPGYWEWGRERREGSERRYLELWHSRAAGARE